MTIRHAVISTSLGELTIAASGDAVTGIYYPGHWYLPAAEMLGERVDADDDVVLSAARIQLEEYLAGERRTFDLPTATQGSDFEEKVWAMLNEIPYGHTTTYGELAERLGDKNLARMVGRAVGHNPISLVVPCHRVVGKDRKLTGYAGGLERKQTLLDLEEPTEARAGKLF